MEQAKGRLWWQEIDVPVDGMDYRSRWINVESSRPIPQRAGHSSGDKSRSATPKRAVGLLHLPLGEKTVV